MNLGLITTTKSPNEDCALSQNCNYPWATTRICSSSYPLKCGADSCTGLEARCDGQSECFATCGGSNSCSRNMMPLNDRRITKLIGNWGLNCTGSRSCSKMQVATLKGDLYCTGRDSCEKIDVNSIGGDLKCEGISSCNSMTAKCKDGETCTAKCNNVLACSNPEYLANPKSTLFTGHWNLECTQAHTCQDVEAICPAGKSCTATCTGFYACDGANFIGNWIRVGPNSGG